MFSIRRSIRNDCVRHRSNVRIVLAVGLFAAFLSNNVQGTEGGALIDDRGARANTRAELVADQASLPAERAMLGVVVANQAGRVVITALYIGGPAEAAGLRVGDQIVSVNGQAQTSDGQLVRLVDQLRPFQRVDLLVNRGSWTRDYVVTLGERTFVAGLPRTQQGVAANQREQRRYSFFRREADDTREAIIYDPYLRALYSDFGP